MNAEYESDAYPGRAEKREKERLAQTRAAVGISSRVAAQVNCERQEHFATQQKVGAINQFRKGAGRPRAQWSKYS